MKNAAQLAASKPASPCSCAVGTFGKLAVRLPDSTASALIWPLSTSEMTPGVSMQM